MTYSICIPNFNYANYLGITFGSIKALTYPHYEVVVADNASTDKSMEVIATAASTFKKFKYQVNPVNVGFAPNLDRVASLASGDYFIMLSSDDLIHPDALTWYNRVLVAKPEVVVSSAWDIIDSEGKKIGRNGPNRKLWRPEDRDIPLSDLLGCDVYRIKSQELLKRSLLQMATPFNFCTVAYPKAAYVKVGGYGASRLINPDKWFHWRLLTQVPEAIYIDHSLFYYRWHNQNQTAQQANTGHLKYMVDEYRNTMEISTEMLAHAGINQRELINAFIKRDVYHHGLGEFSKGRWLKSCRIFFFGLSTYPRRMITKGYFIFYILALLSSPAGSWLFHKLRR